MITDEIRAKIDTYNDSVADLCASIKTLERQKVITEDTYEYLCEHIQNMGEMFSSVIADIRAMDEKEKIGFNAPEE